MSKIDEILHYWIGPPDIDPRGWSKKTKLWYASDPTLDNNIREQFGAELTAAERGQRELWRGTLRGCLALLVLYDQFSRNLYRGKPEVYRNDARAVDVADQIVKSGELADLNVPAHLLAFHPYHHAEDLGRQECVIKLTRHLLKKSCAEWQNTIGKNLAYMENHANIIRRFGRFPHRNSILGRKSTPEEIEHLRLDSRTFGQ